MKEISTDTGRVFINGLPNNCPYCHKSINPIVLHGHRRLQNKSAEVLMYCPDNHCSAAFIGYYNMQLKNDRIYDFNGETSIGKIKETSFPQSIKEISEGFVMIYNQAYAAEQQKLTEICGAGYRKSLEFLIKDYTISINPDKQELIERKLLGSVIGEFVSDEKIRLVAKRAAWLGNDETHYVRKWEGKNIQDLKILIELTVHWIKMEQLTKSLEIEMPE